MKIKTVPGGALSRQENGGENGAMSRLHVICGGATLAVALLAAAASPSLANGWLEARPWQFKTSADRANNAFVLDMWEKKQGGYYDSWKQSYNITNYNTTNIDTQINCSVSSTAVGNSGTNGQTANSPVVNTSGSNSSSSTGNQASNGINNDDPSGVVVVDNNNQPPNSAIGNDQNNSGNISSGVNNSPINVGSTVNTGSASQTLNNNQSNSGNQSASVTDSTACAMAGPIN